LRHIEHPCYFKLSKQRLEVDNNTVKFLKSTSERIPARLEDRVPTVKKVFSIKIEKEQRKQYGTKTKKSQKTEQDYYQLLCITRHVLRTLQDRTVEIIYM